MRIRNSNNIDQEKRGQHPQSEPFWTVNGKVMSYWRFSLTVPTRWQGAEFLWRVIKYFLAAVIKYQFLRADKCWCNWISWEAGGMGTPVGRGRG